MDVPEVIPPNSVVRLVRSDETTPAWIGKEGETFRIGYYVPDDGLNVVWLINATGEYCETTDRETLIRFFKVETLSTETDMFGGSGLRS